MHLLTSSSQPFSWPLFSSPLSSWSPLSSPNVVEHGISRVQNFLHSHRIALNFASLFCVFVY
jgi:hypothetical protein